MRSNAENTWVVLVFFVYGLDELKTLLESGEFGLGTHACALVGSLSEIVLGCEQLHLY